MKKIRIAFISLLLFSCSVPVFSQVNKYVFSQYSAGYVPIDLGSAFVSYGNDVSDDDVFLVDIGFNFYFNGSYYSQAFLNTNGFIYFSTPWTASNYAPLSSGIDNLVISPCGDDLQAQIGAGIISLTTGIPGQRILTIEWINYHHWNESGNYNFQIKLYESNGKIEFVYGLFSSPGTNPAEVGLLGTSTADFNNRSTVSNWSTTTAGAFVNSICLISSTVLPNFGLHYIYEPVNFSISSFASPTIPGCYGASENITLNIRNNTSASIDLSLFPITLSGSNAITNPSTFTPILLNTGSIAALSEISVPFVTGFDMSAPGDYAMTLYLSSANDPFLTNDTIQNTFNSIAAGGTLAVGSDSICLGQASILHLTGENGLIQWQSFNGSSWVNEIGTGSNTQNYTVTPSTTKNYRAQVCGTTTSNTGLVNVIQVIDPVTTSDLRCGPGVVNLSSTGSASTKWFSSSTTGTLLNTGLTYDPLITATSQFMVGNTKPGPKNTSVKITEASLGTVDALEIQNLSNGIINTEGWLLVLGDYIDVNDLNPTYYSLPNYLTAGQILTISDDVAALNYWGENIFWGVGGTGWILLIDNVGQARDFISWGWTSAELANLNVNINGFPFSLNSFIWSGSSIDASSTTNAASMQRIGTSDQNLASDFITDVSSFDVQNAGLNFMSGTCVSSLVPVTGTVTFSDTIIATLSSTYLCGGESSTINVTSLNLSYTYSWSPITGLNSSTSANVIANPTSSTTYTIVANDAGTGCESITYAAITVNQTPPAILTISANPPAICLGDTSYFSAQNSFENPATLGTGSLQNTSITYPSIYGVSNGGARHQILVRASELLASGYQPGPINWIYFFVESMNGGWYVDNFKIKMGQTVLNSLSTFQSGLSLVYSNAGYLPTVGWNGHHLDTQFNWDGTSNILIETCFDSPFYYLDGNPSMKQSPTSFISTISNATNSAAPCVDNTVTGTWAQRPNMKFQRDFNLVYTWSPSLNLNNPSISNPYATSSSTTTYTLNIFDNLTSCASQQSLTLPVGSNMPAAAGLINGSSTVCQGSSNIAYSIPAILNATSYQWNLPAGASISSSPTDSNWVTIDFSAAAMTGVLSVQGVNSCSAVLTGIASADFDITVNPLPGNASIITGSSTVCSGQDSVSFSTGIPSNTLYYHWNLPPGVSIVSGDSTNSVIVTIDNDASSGNISVNGVNACGNGVSSTAFPLTVSPQLNLTINSSTGSFLSCPNDSITLSISPACVGCIHHWSPVSYIPDSSSATPSTNFAQNVLVEIRTSDSLGCAGSGSQFFSIGASPFQPTITLSNDTLYSSLASTYQWYQDGILIPGAIGAYYVVMVDGNYSVEITQGSNSCSSSSAALNVILFGLKENSKINSCHVSPNPFRSQTEIRCTLKRSQNIQIEVYTMLGQKVYARTEQAHAGLNRIRIQRATFEKNESMLLLRVTTENENFTFLLTEIN